MILQRYYLSCLSHASYLVGDEKSRQAVVVDPQRDVDGYVEDAKARGLDIRHVFLTHFHADFAAGHLELRDRVGAAIHLGARARADYEFVPAREGDVLEIGDVRLQVLETPGHTPEGISILLFDLAADRERPHAVLTGDTLFIGDVGRPDLGASQGLAAGDLASMLYDSIHGKLLVLPDDTLVYPAHGAGSACGRALSSEASSTIGRQRAENAALRAMTREAFVALVTRDLPEAPGYFAFDADLNAREHEVLDDVLDGALRKLSLDQAMRLRDDGCTLVDTREPPDFAAAHVAGSLNIGLSGRYASWAGSLLAPTRPIVLITAEGRERESALRLGRIGFDQIAGVVEDAIPEAARRGSLRSWRRVKPDELARRLASPDPPVVLDVRADGERKQASIAGSLHVPLAELAGRLSEVPRDREIVVHCASGFRSSIAASLLESAGFERVTDLEGGIAAWKQGGQAPLPPR